MFKFHSICTRGPTSWKLESLGSHPTGQGRKKLPATLEQDDFRSAVWSRPEGKSTTQLKSLVSMVNTVSAQPWNRASGNWQLLPHLKIEQKYVWRLNIGLLSSDFICGQEWFEPNTDGDCNIWVDYANYSSLADYSLMVIYQQGIASVRMKFPQLSRHCAQLIMAQSKFRSTHTEPKHKLLPLED
jgi:hypothetical protein